VSRLGFVEVLWIVDHHHDDHDQDNQPIEEGGPPAPADRQGQPLNPGSP
jgi:hypothetical protein